MTVVVKNGQRYYESSEFASQSIYEAYNSGETWNSENYVFVNIGSVFPAWITKSEEEKLSRLTNIDEIDQFATGLNILAIPKDDFDKWRQGERKK